MVRIPKEEQDSGEEITRLMNESKMKESIDMYQDTSRASSQGPLLNTILTIWQNQGQSQKKDDSDANILLKQMGKRQLQKASMRKEIKYEKSKKQFVSFIQMFTIRLLYLITLFAIVMTSVDPNNFIQRQELVQTFSRNHATSPGVSMCSNKDYISIEEM